jgi:hypothetical protein
LLTHSKRRDALRILIRIGCAALISAIAFGEEGSRTTKLEMTLRFDAGGQGPFYVISVEPSGVVRRTGVVPPEFPDSVAGISDATSAELRGLLARERFFALRQNYGCAPDLGYRRIEVVLGKRRQAVTFCVGQTDLPLRDVQALLRIWYGTLTALSKKGAVPVWEIDKRILAAKE